MYLDVLTRPLADMRPGTLTCLESPRSILRGIAYFAVAASAGMGLEGDARSGYAWNLGIDHAGSCTVSCIRSWMTTLLGLQLQKASGTPWARKCES
jgi:hypothetical protein